MDEMQEKHERGVGDDFIKWYNIKHSTVFVYHDRGADPPDLIYRDGDQEMLLEITASYYGPEQAKMYWQNARRVADAPSMYMLQNPDQNLIEDINTRLAKKCDKPYPINCTLVLQIYPDLISAGELDVLIEEIQIPSSHSFKSIYLAGIFTNGYQCWKLA